jgi:dTMP kinase
VRPDLTILLDLDPGRGLGRAAVRDQGQADRFELLGDAFHRRVRELYHTLACEESGRFFVVDAARPPEAIEEEIWHEVVRRFR